MAESLHGLEFQVWDLEPGQLMGRDGYLSKVADAQFPGPASG